MMLGAHRAPETRAMESSAHSGGNTESPFIRLPDRQAIFARRAARFRQLAQIHISLSGYLALMADLAEMQHESVEHLPFAAISEKLADGPPLDVSNWHRDPPWRKTLRSIAERLDPEQAPLFSISDRILQADDAELETWANALLSGVLEDIDPGLAPFVAAALQAQWVAMAARLDAGQFGAAPAGHLCPVCGSLPVSSLLQTGGAVQGLRYLVCGLCASEWNRPRIHCIHCGSGKDVAYFGIEGAGDAVRAEACSDCKTYVKVMNREKDARVDPFADDLATLSLDILVTEQGYQRLGFNPLLIPGG